MFIKRQVPKLLRYMCNTRYGYPPYKAKRNNLLYYGWTTDAYSITRKEIRANLRSAGFSRANIKRLLDETLAKCVADNLVTEQLTEKLKMPGFIRTVALEVLETGEVEESGYEEVYLPVGPRLDSRAPMLCAMLQDVPKEGPRVKMPAATMAKLAGATAGGDGSARKAWKVLDSTGCLKRSEAHNGRSRVVLYSLDMKKVGRLAKAHAKAQRSKTLQPVRMEALPPRAKDEILPGNNPPKGGKSLPAAYVLNAHTEDDTDYTGMSNDFDVRVYTVADILTDGAVDPWVSLRLLAEMNNITKTGAVSRGSSIPSTQFDSLRSLYLQLRADWKDKKLVGVGEWRSGFMAAPRGTPNYAITYRTDGASK